MKRAIVIAAALCAASALLPLPAVAQTSDSWQFSAYLYGYLPHVDTKATLTGPSGVPIYVDTSISPSKIIEHLKMGFTGAFEAQKGSWGAFTDVIYLNVGGLHSRSHIRSVGGIGIPVGVSTNGSFDLKSTVWTLAGDYRLIDKPDATLDVLAGARLLDLKEHLGFQLSGDIGPLPLPGRSGDGDLSKSVWDGIVGVKGHFAMSADRKWFLPYYLDVGTGQSHLTWQGIGGIGYTYSWGTLTAVWRYMDYKGKSGEAIDTLSFSGPMFGVSFHW